MSQLFRIAGFASSKSLQENVQLQEQEVSSSGRRPSEDRDRGVQMELGEEGGNIEGEETPSQSSAPHYQYEDDEVEVVEVLNNNNTREREVKDEKKEDFKKPLQGRSLGNFSRNLEMIAGAGPRIKGVKKFYRCELCHVTLSSQETMVSHVSGTPHRKKLNLEEEAHGAKIRRGLLSPEEPMPEFVKQIPVPASAKPKIPRRLHERIKHSEEPIIGLQFITEILPESDPEMEPHYECDGKIYFNPLSQLKLHELSSHSLKPYKNI